MNCYGSGFVTQIIYSTGVPTTPVVNDAFLLMSGGILLLETGADFLLME